MLLQKLNQDHIGLTAYGLVNINKSFIVTLVTFSVSYAVIVFRFGMMFNQDQLIKEVLNAANQTLLANVSYSECPTVIPPVETT